LQLQIDFKIVTGIDAHIFPNKWSQIAPYVLDLGTKKEACPSLCELHNGMCVYMCVCVCVCVCVGGWVGGWVGVFIFIYMYIFFCYKIIILQLNIIFEFAITFYILLLAFFKIIVCF